MADALTPIQLDELRRLLQHERDLLAKRLAAAGERSTSLGDLQDGAAEEAHGRAQLHVNAHDRRRLVEVEAAIQRIDDGTYGVCEDTGEFIGYARLKTEPTTRFTVEALELREADQRREDLRGSSDEEADPY